MVQMLIWWHRAFVVLLEGLPMGQLLRVTYGLFDPSVTVMIEFAFEDVTSTRRITGVVDQANHILNVSLGTYQLVTRDGVCRDGSSHGQQVVAMLVYRVPSPIRDLHLVLLSVYRRRDRREL